MIKQPLKGQYGFDLINDTTLYNGKWSCIVVGSDTVFTTLTMGPTCVLRGTLPTVWYDGCEIFGNFTAIQRASGKPIIAYRAAP
jgi:hypothetical protein